MKTLTTFPLLLLPLVALHGCSRAEAQTTKAVPDAADPARGPIELTVYTGNFGMVRETRRVDLAKGRGRVGITDVSKSLDGNSVLFSWPDTKDATVVSSTYDLGTGDSGKLLSRFLGKTVELVYRGMDGREGERIKGILEVADPGNIVVKADGRYIVNPNATVEAPADAGIVAIPQLSAEVQSDRGGATDLGLSYMTEGLSWNADYTLTLDPDRDKLDLECWATVTNRTGTDYPGASIRFVAGSPNRAVRSEAQAPGSYARDRAYAAAPMAKPRSQEYDMKPETMGELYAYPYESTATIRQDQKNRVRMLGSDGVRVERVYSIALPAVYYDYETFGGNPDRRLTATMGINFTNGKGAGLGLPLPAGAVRVYEPDGKGAARYVGAASIGDTPKDARVSLTLTNVFNVYARARQTGWAKVDKKHIRRTVEITVSNEKKTDADVRLVQNLGSDWRIDSQSVKGRKLNAGQNEWTVSVPAEGETKLRYSVVLGY